MLREGFLSENKNFIYLFLIFSNSIKDISVTFIFKIIGFGENRFQIRFWIY